MAPPIIVDANGDIMFFSSVAELQQSLEPIDVLNGEYQVFDCEGRRLQLTTRSTNLHSNPVLQWIDPVELQEIALNSGVKNVETINDLKQRLLNFIACASNTEQSKVNIESLDTAQKIVATL